MARFLLCSGGLNPLSGLCFPLFSMVFPWVFSIRVAICGKERNQNCSFLSSIYLQIFHVFWSLSAFPRGSEESQSNAVLSAHHSFAAPIPPGLLWESTNAGTPLTDRLTPGHCGIDLLLPPVGSGLSGSRLVEAPPDLTDTGI